MPLNELLQEKREGILRIASQRGASNMRVFESVARNEANSKSDIDLLVDKEKRTIRKETIYEEHACSTTKRSDACPLILRAQTRS